MAKFCLSDSETVLASLKDPVAVDCISKLANNATASAAIETTPFVNTTHQPMVEEHGSIDLLARSLAPPKIGGGDDLLSCVSREPLSTVVAPTVYADTSEYGGGVKVLSEGLAVGSQVASVSSSSSSEIPLFIASHDLLQPLPLITLPLVACSIAGSNDVITVNTNDSSDKPFVTISTTVAAVSELNSLPVENVEVKPIYRTL